MQAVTPFLMFEGNAEEAISFYISIFPDSTLDNITHYDSGNPAVPGKVMHATFTLGGRQFRCIDSPVKHDFTFTPSVSIFVQCSTGDEIEMIYKSLSEGGQILMPLDTYPFSKKYVWLNDRFGVSWQIGFNE
jgi:predicted 3-demethylubiquinone-9 3-methyltransferase (glyoxalase superfamily)